MRVGEVADMDIVADAGAVGCRIVRVIDVHAVALAKCSGARHFNGVGGACARPAGAATRVGARGVEKAQRRIGEVMYGGGVAQHDFGHQFGG